MAQLPPSTHTGRVRLDGDFDQLADQEHDVVLGRALVAGGEAAAHGIA